jgi:hypothetical protein
MATSTTTRPIGVTAQCSRAILLVLSLLFVAGSLGQFFLADLSDFDSADYWANHRALGHGLGILAHAAYRGVTESVKEAARAAAGRVAIIY